MFVLHLKTEIMQVPCTHYDKPFLLLEQLVFNRLLRILLSLTVYEWR